MFRSGGYAVITGPEGIVEMDTFTCGHHNGVVHVPPWRDLDQVSALCFVCQKRICRKCEKERQLTLRCVTFEKRLEMMERVVEGSRARDALFDAMK